MRSLRIVFVLAITSSTVLSVKAQNQPQRDPQAVAVLTQTLAVTGWAVSPNNVAAQATVTQFRGNETVVETVRWKALGHDKIRIEVDTPQGTVTNVRNGHRAALVKGGQSTPLPGHIAATMHSIQFLFFPLANAAKEPGAAILYIGSDSVNGENAHVIELRVRENAGRIDSPLSRAWRFVLYVSANSFLPLKLDYNRLGGDNSNVVARCSRLFADYRSVGTILVPYQQTDFLNGQKVATIQFTQIQTNPGLSPTEFDVPF